MEVLENKRALKTKHYMKQKYAWLKHTGQRMAAHLKGKGGFGMNELLGIAAALIIAAFVIIPGLREFADSVMDRLQNWWSTTIVSKIFSSS